MENFYKLSIESKRSAIKLYEALIEKDFGEYERVISEKDYNEIKEIRKKLLFKMIKIVKEEIINDLYNGKYGVHH